MSGWARAAFLDRDGTLIAEGPYVGRIQHVAFFPWSIDAVRALNRADLRVVLVTNQSGVARGFFTEADVQAVHRHIGQQLEAGKAHIDAYYYCPHHPEGTVSAYVCYCDCRKPRRGLVDQAARELGVDPARSFVVGDKWLDIELAHAVGARGVLVRTGYGAVEETRPSSLLRADAVVDNLIEAAGWILRQL